MPNAETRRLTARACEDRGMRRLAMLAIVLAAVLAPFPAQGGEDARAVLARVREYVAVVQPSARHARRRRALRSDGAAQRTRAAVRVRLDHPGGTWRDDRRARSAARGRPGRRAGAAAAVAASAPRQRRLAPDGRHSGRERDLEPRHGSPQHQLPYLRPRIRAAHRGARHEVGRLASW